MLKDMKVFDGNLFRLIGVNHICTLVLILVIAQW